MRINRWFWVFILFIGCGAIIKAQDIHFTQFNMSPLTLNASNTGAFEGTARITGIYRDQWSSFLRNQFTTSSFSVDAPLLTGFKENHWVGVGGVIVSDEAGTSRLATNISKLSIAYHLGLGKGYKNIVSFGIQGGSIEKRMRPDDLRFADEFPEDVGGGGAGFGKGVDRNFMDKKSATDFGLGVKFRSLLSDKQSIVIGLSVNHLNRPKISLLSQGDGQENFRLPVQFAGFANYKQLITEGVTIEPSLFFQTMGGTSEVVVQSVAGYQFNEDLILRGGLGYRLGDAAQLLLGADYEDFRVGLAYDLNTSSLVAATKSVGGFELALSYIIKIYKKPDVIPAILCPDF